MNKYFLIIMFIGFVEICFGQIDISLQDKSQNLLIVDIDTVIEKNAASNLDLKRHQLFQDTTRSHVYYDRKEKWQPLLSPDQHVVDYISYRTRDCKPTIVDLKDFPRLWVTVRKFNEQYVLYDRCDGADPVYGITDSTLNIYGPLEFDAVIINKLTMISDTGIQLELGINEEKSKVGKANFSISKTDKPDIYLLKYKGKYNNVKSFVTPIENIRNFDLIVNHCPVNKVIEFLDRFEKIDE